MGTKASRPDNPDRGCLAFNPARILLGPQVGVDVAAPGLARVQAARVQPGLPIPAPLSHDLDRYLETRAATEGAASVADLRGPVFITPTGRRLDQPAVFRLVRRIGKAAHIPGAERLSVHSLRHSVATAALEEASLHAVQDLLGHADPRTTRRYDRARNSLDRSAAYAISKLFAED